MSAISALKGYRTQFLYSLYYILSNVSNDLRFRLEGQEDLDILDESNRLLQVIQVKNLSTQVNQSDLISREGTSFFKRAIKIQQTNPNVIPILVSFGAISTEIKNLKNRQGISSKEKKDLQKFSVTEKDWQVLKNSIDFVEVNEDDICNKILVLLKEKYSTIDPAVSADYVLYWLSNVAEKQKLISQKEVFIRIEAMGQYLSERDAITQLYNSAIKPLHQLQASNFDANILKSEFYYGVSARYEHILNDIDVPRNDHLTNIRDLFTQSNVVIIQGASGQGKSTLAYRYVHDNLPSTLIYELRVPNESLISIKSIQAIMGITKGLNAPVLFLINVIPNSTEWINIVREFADIPNVKFLITIRHEDWRNAALSGLNFLHKELELELNEAEAQEIYHSLSKKNEIVGYADFQEAWIKFGERGPLLEFVYTITQGQPLRDKLNQQIGQVKNDPLVVREQLEILRVVSLTDLYGSKVDALKLKQNTHTAVAVERFEKEYLLKYVSEKKYVVGLHPVRSAIITEILFDEFLINKKDYVLKCIDVMDDGDIYHFLLHCFFYKIITPGEFLEALNNYTVPNWSCYRSIFKSLLWVGIRDYIEENAEVLDQCYDKAGDSWYIVTDIYHGNSLNLKEIHELISDEFKQLAQEVKDKIQTKDACYKYAISLLNTVALPKTSAHSGDNWESLGEMMFWLRNIPNSAQEINFTDYDFETTFQTIDLPRLSKLMFGMHNYSSQTNSLQIKYADHFINRIRNTYKIPELRIEDSEISLNYIIDVFETTEGVSLNDGIMEIIDLLRYAYPDKKKYNAQGHGHRLNLFGLPYDEAKKSISVNNLPLDEWVDLNAITGNLYTYKKRPRTWVEFHNQLYLWETSCNEIIADFNSSVSSFIKSPDNLKPLVHLIDNAQHISSPSIKEPQSISNPFGIQATKLKKFKERKKIGEKEARLFSKYDSFFKAYRDFRLPLEKFIKQSGAAIYWRIKTKQDSAIVPDADNERISQVNIFSAIEEIQPYIDQKKSNFSKYISNKDAGITKDNLYTTSSVFKHFLSSANSKPGKLGQQLINQLLSDFEARILKGCKTIPKNEGYQVKYLRNKDTKEKAIFTIAVENYVLFVNGITALFALLKEAIGKTEHTSLKQLMLQNHFTDFYFIPLVRGNTANNHWLKFPLHSIRDKEFEQLAFYNWVQSPIDAEVVANLKLTSWESQIPKIFQLRRLTEEYTKVVMMAEHQNDLKYFNELEFDEIGLDILTSHYLSKSDEIQQSFQFVLDFLVSMLNEFPGDETKIETDEYERAYFQAIIAIKDNIFPTQKGDEEHYEVKINADIISDWVKRLEICTQNIGILNLLLIDKYIDQHLDSVKQ